MDHAGLQFPVPQPQRGCRYGERQQRLAFAHLLLAALAVGDVVHGEQPAGLAIELRGAHRLQRGALFATARDDLDLVGIELAGLSGLVNEADTILRLKDTQLDGGNAHRLRPGVASICSHAGFTST